MNKTLKNATQHKLNSIREFASIQTSSLDKINILLKNVITLQIFNTFIIPMQLKHIIRNFFAILLIVVFSLKAGVGLYLHNQLHVKNNSAAAQSASTEIKYSCNCIADFYLPVTQTPEQKINLPFLTYGEHIYFYSSSILFTSYLFNSLRAPPIISC